MKASPLTRLFFGVLAACSAVVFATHTQALRAADATAGERGTPSTSEAKPPAALAGEAAKFPAHWGEPPAIQTRDYRPLPGGYGMGSSTLAKWIQENLDKEKAGSGPAAKARQPNGSGTVNISGELKQWHKVTLTVDGPFAHERDDAPNPFTDVAFSVTFAHESGAPKYTVPGYFAADGDAANTSAESGTKWRAHLSPDLPGTWTYSVSFTKGTRAALGETKGEAWKPFDGQAGRFDIAPSDKAGRDFRAHGRLQYVGRHHLQFAGSTEYFLKAGADSPEALLAYADFDGTEPGGKQQARSGEAAPTKALKTWEPHRQDWREGDPSWKGDKGKGLIGALNYLAGKGCNAFSFLTYNAGGDGDNVWPFVSRNDKLHYDCSKLDQWGIVFDHAQSVGLYCHFKLQETENDDQRLGGDRKSGDIPEALDGGALGPDRKLYLRELVARYGHLLALNWNLGEENTHSAEEQRAISDYLREIDAYQHHRVVHTYPNEQDRVYAPLLGDQSSLTGASLQNAWNQVHQRTLQWVGASAKAGRPWVIANDEQGSADTGVPPDFGYKGYAGKTSDGKVIQTPDDIRKLTLWGNLMAGGAGVEYYFGYKLPENDLGAEDWRSRDRSWEWCRIALEFFREQKLPFWEMKNANALIGNPKNENTKFCLAKAGEYYLVYLPSGGTTSLNLAAEGRTFTASWLNPRTGGALIPAPEIQGKQEITTPPPPAEPDQDWLLLLRAK